MPRSQKNYDPGLQQERTALAWERTGLALMVAAGLLERALQGPRIQMVTFVAAVIFLLGLFFVIRGRARYIARWRLLEQGEGTLSSGPIVTVAVATVLLGLFALAAIARSAFG